MDERDRTIPVETPARTSPAPSDHNGGVSRREFIKVGALAGSGALLAGQLPQLLDLARRAEAGIYLTPEEEYVLAQATQQLYSVCMQCNTQCGIKVKILDGVAVKIDGSPLSPWNLDPHLPYKTSPFDAAKVEGLLCPKGQAGIQTAYDPYRIVKVLKRAGKRGEDKWVSLPFDQAIKEIVEGGMLFKDVPGEENRKVEGLRDLWALRDPKVAKELAADVKKIWQKGMTVAEFQTKHKEQLKHFIDPNHPDLGPKNNQIVFAWGRLKGGRGDLIKRFANAALGTVNTHGHTTVCQGSLYFTGKAMSEQFLFDEKDKKMKWTKGAKFYWQADTGNAEFLLFVGASPFEANYGPTNRGSRIAKALAEGRMKIAVVDPRLSKVAAKAWKWVPIKPGTEGAFALGMIRWVIENNRHDARYLANANKAAAKADGEPTWCNAAWLVKIDEKGKPGAFLRASEIGLPKVKRVHKDKKTGEETRYEFDPFLVQADGKPVPFDPYDEEKVVKGDLRVDAVVKGIRVKSGLQILWEEAAIHPLEGWAQICDVRPRDLAELADEFTRHGKRAVADIHRGVSQHTNGFYNVLAWYSLNLLIGNYDWKGGLCKAATYDPSGGKKVEVKGEDGKVETWQQPFPVENLMPKKLSPFGVDLLRHNVKYEETTIFKGYPARRPWFPLASDLYQEIIPSAGDAYPYPIKVLFLYMGTPVYALPAGHTNIEILTDLNKIPLFIASDIVVGETTMYADYIFPDLTYLERWEMAGSHPNMAWKVQPIRQPVIPPVPESVSVFGEEMPISLESLIMGIAEKLGLPGFGKSGFGEGQDFLRPEEFYLRMAANVAAGEKPGQAVPDADVKEVQLFLDARKHLPKSIFDVAKWEKAVGPWWRKVVYVLNRGGRFDDFEKGYEGNLLKNRYGKLINLYQEKTAKTKNSMTGKYFPGIATYIPAPQDVLGRPVEDEKSGFDLHLITYREVSMTKSRTIGNYWLLALNPENAILINQRDADRMGIRNGQRVKVTSASNPEGVWDLRNGRIVPMAGKVKIIQGIRPGVVAFSLGHGHWAYGASDIVIDGKVVRGDPRRGRGVHANAALRVDPHLKNTCLSDLTGGSAVFYDTRVKLVKV
jgi:anaerobic selenocysteine-containing dehydrogenase